MIKNLKDAPLRRGIVFLILFLALMPIVGITQWRVGPPMLDTVGGAACCVLNGKIYVIGGYGWPNSKDNNAEFNNVQIFDPTSNSWSEGPPISTPRHYATASVCDGKIYLFGGNSDASVQNSVEVFDTNSNKWSYTTPMLSAQDVLSSCTIDSNIYVTNGSNYFDIFNIPKQTWIHGTLPPLNRENSSCIAVNGKVYLIAGDDYWIASRTAQVFDPASGLWDSTGALSEIRYSHTSCALANQIYVFGGRSDNGQNDFNFVLGTEDFDTKTNTSNLISQIPIPIIEASSAPLNGKIYILGGFDGNNELGSTHMQIFDPGASLVSRAEPIGIFSIFPDPFSQSTTISFSSSERSVAEVTIVNLLGAEVACIFSGELGAGNHQFTWYASGMPPGMYVCVVRMNGKVQQTPILLMRN
jgi:hypothetical protein